MKKIASSQKPGCAAVIPALAQPEKKPQIRHNKSEVFRMFIKQRGVPMLRLVRLYVLLLFFIPMIVYSGPERVENTFKTYFYDLNAEVQKAQDPQTKREIMNASFEKFFSAIDRVEKMADLSPQDREGLERFRKQIQNKHDELNGLNGYQRVADQDLNQFARYVQQDMEQADRYITISLTTLLLVLLIVLLLA